MTIGGQTFERGVGTHSVSEIAIQLDGKAVSFTAQVGLDDEIIEHKTSAEFIVIGDVYEYITRSFTVTSLISFAFYELIALCSSYQFEPFSTESIVITLIVLIIGCAVAFFADIIAQKIK